MLTHSRCVLNLTKPCPIVSYHLCGAPSFVWYLLQFFIYHDYYFCDPKRIVASWSRGFQVICFIPRPELLINLPRSLIDMETVTQNLLQPSHSGKRLIMSKARWGVISLAILVQNKAKYSIMLARRALSKMKKIWLYRRKAKDRQIVVETFGKDRPIREKHECSRVPNISYHAA